MTTMQQQFAEDRPVPVGDRTGMLAMVWDDWRAGLVVTVVAVRCSRCSAAG